MESCRHWVEPAQRIDTMRLTQQKLGDRAAQICWNSSWFHTSLRWQTWCYGMTVWPVWLGSWLWVTLSLTSFHLSPFGIKNISSVTFYIGNINFSVDFIGADSEEITLILSRETLSSDLWVMFELLLLCSLKIGLNAFCIVRRLRHQMSLTSSCFEYLISRYGHSWGNFRNFGK